MAHILVYLQRTPQGIHPASAVALCLARDIGSERGATVTALCTGDAGALDKGVLAASSRFGADITMFGGPHTLEDLVERLHPVHVITPWTPEGLAAVATLPCGPAMLRWLDRPDPPWAGADAITGLVAGTPPWHAFGEQLEAEYANDVELVPMPPWVDRAAAVAAEGSPPTFQIAGEGPVRYVGPEILDDSVRRRLEQLGAEPMSLDGAPTMAGGTLLWLLPGAGPIPEAQLAGRDAGMRVVLLPGPDATVDASWSSVDWVFAGPWPQAIDGLIQTTTAGGPWRMGHG